jgi:RNA polymerase sigma-32 factor
MAIHEHSQNEEYREVGKMETIHVPNMPQTSDVLDPFRLYLSEISRHPILSKEDERDIAGRIQLGDREAEQKLAVANLRLVVKIALDYYSYHLNVLDLIQEGNVGLLHAVKKFDPGRGTRFSTYASFWIRAYILKYLMDSWSIVKVGTKDSQRKLFYSLNKEKDRLEKAGITPSSQILAENLEVSADDIEDMEKRLSHGDVSLEDPLYEGTEETVMSTLSTDEDIEETVAEKEKRTILAKRLTEFKKLLSDKELFILEHRIMSEDPITLREIGERFNTSRESIRQLETKISKSLTRNLRSSTIWA